MKMKSILKEWRSFINESELWGQNPKEFDQAMFNKVAKSQKIDKTDVDFGTFIEEVVSLLEKNDNVFVSFVDKYDEETPSLGVSPVISYSTPHGVYGYPLKKSTLYQFITTGMPTQADFATEREFMHVYTLDDARSIKIGSDNRTNYRSSNYVKDLKTIVRMFLQMYNVEEYYYNSFVYYNITRDNKDKIVGDDHSITDIMMKIGVSMGKNFEDFLYAMKYFGYIRESGSNNGADRRAISDELVDFIAGELDSMSVTSMNSFASRARIDDFYKIYFAAYYLSKNTNMTRDGGVFTMLLSGVGIDSINDAEGTSLLHGHEPQQAVAMDVGGKNSFNLFGTYKNYFIEFEKRDIYFVPIAEDKLLDLAEKGKINILDYVSEETAKRSRENFKSLSQGSYTSDPITKLIYSEADKFLSSISSSIQISLPQYKYNNDNETLQKNIDRLYKKMQPKLQYLFDTVDILNLDEKYINLLLERIEGTLDHYFEIASVNMPYKNKNSDYKFKSKLEKDGYILKICEGIRSKILLEFDIDLKIG